MLVRNLVFGLAAGSLVAAPLGAKPGPTEIERQSAPGSSDSEIGSNSTLFFVAAILAVAVGIFLLIDDDDAAMSP